MARTAANSKTKGKGARGGAAAELRANAAAREEQAAAPEPLVDGGAGSDIAGVVLAVVAVASLIAVVSPSSAPVSRAVAGFYHLGFGLGAYVLPLVILAASVLVFLRGRVRVSVRAAAGGTIVFVGVLTCLSLLVGQDGSVPGSMYQDAYLVVSGGYLGAAVASVLQGALGLVIAVVIAVGIVVLGLVMLGFSVGGALQAAASRAREVARRRHVDVNDSPWGDAAATAGAAGQRAHTAGAVVAGAVPAEPAPAPQGSLFDEGAAETTFLGSRETTVMGGGAVDAGENPLVDVTDTLDAERAETTLLGRHLGRRSRKKGSRGAALGAINEARAGLDAAPADAPDDPLMPEPAAKVARSVKVATAAEAPSMEAPEAATDDDLPWDEPSDDTVLDANSGTKQPIPSFLKGQGAVCAPAAPSSAAVPVPGPSATTKNRSVAPAAAVPSTAVTPATGSEAVADDEGEGQILPPASMLRHNPRSAQAASSSKELEQTAAALQSTLHEFGLRSTVVGWIAGPTVTTFKVQPGEGERVSRINSLEDDIALTLATDSVRIFAPIPGTSLVGIEIPNRNRQVVDFGDILPYVKGGPLEFALGRDAEGAPMVADLAKMPHLLIAGTTGSGKSVVISSIVMSLLMRTFPQDVRLIMIDPKRVEFAPYDGLPHLYVPVVTEPKQAASALQWAVSEMERRLKVFERIGVRKISTFNDKQAAGEFEKYDNPPAKMPYLVIVIDELSDLMMVAGKDVEASIVRIAQLGRAAGIHMIVATQRPSSNVVTGLIKANITNRIGLTVATGIDSRVILDQTGAEKLTGQGDMLFSRVDWGKPKRIQGCYVSDEEIASVVEFVKEHGQAEYHEEILSAVVPASMQGGGGAAADAPAEDDPLLWDAARIVVDSQLGSTSGLQRRLKVGYARAGRIMDMLEEHGVVGPPDGSKPREVLLDMEGLKALEALESPLTDEEVGGF